MERDSEESRHTTPPTNATREEAYDEGIFRGKEEVMQLVDRGIALSILLGALYRAAGSAHMRRNPQVSELVSEAATTKHFWEQYQDLANELRSIP